MPNDPGLANDSCFFIEAATGDGGNHNPNSVWWLSPDIQLIGPVSGPDNADAGQTNPVTVTCHRQPAGSNCSFPGDESLTVELWVANPSLVLSPRVPSSATRVGFIGAAVPAEGETITQQIDWDAPANPAADDPQSPGHKCLLARVYSSSRTPSSGAFFVPDDQHVAQHNLSVIRSPRRDLVFKVNTLNPLRTHPVLGNPPPNAKLRAVLDLIPNNFVRNTILNRLELFAGFQHLRTQPLGGGFKFDLTNLHATNVVDHSHPAITLPFPNLPLSFEASVVLDSRHITQISFLADLKGLGSGEACIFHLIQMSITNIVEGGLTLVVLRT